MAGITRKIALVTGGAKGIGAAICRTLAADGYFVWVHYHTSKAEAQRLAAEICGQAICADIGDVDAVRRMFIETDSIDLLVNNAGLAHYGLATETSMDMWRRLFTVNVDGAFCCVQCVLPHMLAQKRGNIINIASIWGQVGAACEVAYSASKAAVIGLTKALAKELGPSGIRVNCVSPGAVDTDMLSNLTAEEKSAFAQDTPLGRLGAPQDIAAVVSFLASDSASLITGQVISPNAGAVM